MSTQGLTLLVRLVLESRRVEEIFKESLKEKFLEGRSLAKTEGEG